MSEPQPRSRKPLRIVIILLVLGGAAFGIWKIFFSKPAMPANVIALSGRIEGDDSAIAPKVTGRILEIRFREGDAVKAGETIALLDDPQMRAREDQAQDALRNAGDQVRTAQAQIPVLEQQQTETELQVGQARLDAEGRVHQAEQQLAAAEAQLAQQEATLKINAFDREAYTKLARDGAVPERQGRQAQATADSQEAVVAAARRNIDALRGSLNVAKANLTNPEIHSAQSAAILKQIAQQKAQIESAIADEARARAQLVEAQENRDDLTVIAPFSGTVVTRTAEPGEVVQAGTAIVTLLDLSKVYLRGFVPEAQIGKVKAGQSARVYLDSNPSQALDAVVGRIDPQATFTPENTYFRDDRVKQVVGLKLNLKTGIGFAKPGMPADGEILVSPETPGKASWPSGGTHK
ncbi:MAG: HlyD family efflux transporter periplasmic adaptor subunit [Bryobacteraceae bacterium]|jgi:HlyD family secretion protein